MNSVKTYDPRLSGVRARPEFRYQPQNFSGRQSVAIEVKRKCIESPEEKPIIKPISQVKPLPEDDSKSLKFVSYIKVKQPKYNNPIIPVLPLVFTKVKDSFVVHV